MSWCDFFGGIVVGAGLFFLVVAVVFGGPSGSVTEYSAHIITPGIIEVTTLRNITEYYEMVLNVDGSTQLFPHYRKGEHAEIHLGPGTHHVQIVGTSGPGVLGKRTLVDITTQGCV